MTSNKKTNYVLKDKEASELFRLGFQHQVWLEETAKLCRRAGFGLGQTLLDLGCGPGYLSFDLSRLVGPNGRVISVDNSKNFIEHINASKDSKEYGNITTKLADIRELNLKPGSLDGAVARWVLMFVPDINTVIQTVASALKSNGVFAVMDYFHFRSMSIWPRKESFPKIYHAVFELIKRNGGNADIGAMIPQILGDHGFSILETYPIFRIGKPGSLLWQWLELTGRNHTNLIENGLITDEELREYYKDWSTLSTNPNAFFTAPPVFVTIGIKP